MDTVIVARDISLTILAFLGIVFMVAALIVMLRLYREVTHVMTSARRIAEEGEKASKIITNDIIQPIARQEEKASEVIRNDVLQPIVQGVTLATLLGTGLAFLKDQLERKKAGHKRK